MAPALRFSIQNLLSLREWQTHAEVYANSLEDCRLAEALGFEAVWLAEHHTLKKHYDLYRSEWRATHGTDDGADICLNKIIYVADSSRRAREDLVEPVRWFFQTQAGLIADPAGAPADQYRFYRKVRENLLSLSDERALEEAVICGDPEEVADKIRMHHETLGVAHFMGAFSRGGLPQEKVTRSMRLFAEKVMPKLA